jgi:hypothetical protein
LISDVTEKGSKRGNGEEWEHRQEHMERQRRLLCALLRDETILAEFMTYLVTDRVCGDTESELGRVFGVRPQEEMLEPVYTGMSEEDARFFREVREDDVFWENTELFECCFGVGWVGASLIEIKRGKEGDMSAAEREADISGEKK